MNIKTANRLCELRKKHNLSQEELADKLGVSRQAVSKWERSESSPDTDNLIQLAKLYGISLDELLNGDDAIDIIEENKNSNSQDNSDSDVIFEDNDGTIVSTGKGVVTIKDDEGNVVTVEKGKTIVTDKDGKSKTIVKKDLLKKFGSKEDKIAGTITGITTLVVVISYFILGILSPLGFGYGAFWFLFIAIPVPASIYKSIKLKNGKHFAYPVFITALYCALGVFLKLWHPLWVLFITIPIYYMVVGIFKKDVEDDDEVEDEDIVENEN